MRIQIIGQINDKSFAKFSRALDRHRSGDVHIDLYSEGGQEDGGLAFHGKIKAHPNKVIVTVHGMCDSAALAILVAADYRQCTPEATFLVHDSTITITGTISEIAQELARQTANEHKWDRMMSEGSSYPPEFWRHISQNSTTLTAEQALKYGLIDKIIQRKEK